MGNCLYIRSHVIRDDSTDIDDDASYVACSEINSPPVVDKSPEKQTLPPVSVASYVVKPHYKQTLPPASDVYNNIIHFNRKINTRFFNTFHHPELEKVLNSNIPDWMYDKKQTLDNLRGTKSNEVHIASIEEVWRKRQSVSFTPQGMVVMTYSPSKQAFEFKCDVTPNPLVLNACAMEFVLRFCCRELVAVEFHEEKTDDNKNKAIPPSRVIPFVDLSEYDQEAKDASDYICDDLIEDDRGYEVRRVAKKTPAELPPPEKRYTKFIRSGKITGIWQPTPEKKKVDLLLDRLILDFKSKNDYDGMFDGCEKKGYNHRATKPKQSFTEYLEKHNNDK